MTFTPAIFWLILTVALAVVEISTLGLVTIWFAVGSVFAFILALIGVGVPFQIAAFIVGSVVALLFARPVVAGKFKDRIKKTNIDAVIGRTLIAKTDIDNIRGTGKVDMDGSTWLAASTMDNVVIHAGEEVKVVEVRGVKLIVEREI